MVKKIVRWMPPILASLMLFTASSANASPITVESLWERGPTAKLITTAVFESGGITDFSSHAFSLTSFDLVFNPALGSITAVSAVLTPTDEVIIRFSAANVIDYTAGAVQFTPGVFGPNHFSINPSLDRLVVQAGFSSQANHLLVSSAVTVPAATSVPLPLTGVLFLTGLLGLAGLRLRERHGR